MGIVVKIKADGTVKYLDEKEVQLKKAQKLFYKVVATKMNSNIIKQYQTEGAFFLGSKWKQLSPVTIESRRKGGGAGTPMILQDTGMLKKHTIATATAKGVQIGFTGGSENGQTYADIGRKHQEGRGRLPQRQIIAINQQLQTEFNDYLTEIINKVFNDK